MQWSLACSLKLIFVVSLVTFSSAVDAATITRLNRSCFYRHNCESKLTLSLLIEGEITKGDADNFSRMLAERSVLSVILRSPGGSVQEALSSSALASSARVAVSRATNMHGNPLLARPAPAQLILAAYLRRPTRQWFQGCECLASMRPRLNPELASNPTPRQAIGGGDQIAERKHNIPHGSTLLSWRVRPYGGSSGRGFGYPLGLLLEPKGPRHATDWKSDAFDRRSRLR